MAGELHVETYPRKRVQTDKGDLAPDEYGWRVQDANGKLTAVGGEGFTRREDAHRAFRSAAADLFILAGFSETSAEARAATIPIIDLEG